MSGKRDGEYRQVDSLIAEYAGTWTALFRYDEGVMPAPDGVSPSVRALEYRDAMSDIRRLKDVLMQRGEATELFGQERGDAFKGLLGSIEQTMFGEPLYGSREEKAANLLYFIIKDHPFSDGNKRIGSFMFLRYMDMQGMDVRMTQDAMTTLALLVAKSDPSDKDLMIRLTMGGLVGRGPTPSEDLPWAGRRRRPWVGR